MLTHFGTVFALCHNYHSLTLLNFHKENVSRGTVVNECFTWNKIGGCRKCFTCNKQVLTTVNLFL